LFIRKMIEIGERDGRDRCGEIGAFLGLNPRPANRRQESITLAESIAH
jgi:hypothetical protein